MLIKKVELSNITTHKNTSIEFKEGVNILYGRNGAGKSTVMKMIGFALFNSLAGNQKDYVSKNQPKKYGQVNIYFVGKDGIEYKLERRINGSHYKIIEVRSNVSLKINKLSDFYAFIKEQMGIEEEFSLPTIFEDIIGPPQGTFTAPFLETKEKTRKTKFNPILRVDIYEKYFENFREILSKHKDNIKDLESVLQIKSAEKQDMEKTLEELENKKKEQKELELKLKTYETKLTELNTKKRDLDQIKEKITELEQNLQLFKERKNNINNLLNENIKQRKDAEKAKQICDENKGAHDLYNQKNKELTKLREDEKRLRNLETKLEKMKNEKTKLDTKISSNNKRLSELNEVLSKSSEITKGYEKYKKKKTELENNRTKLKLIEKSEEELRRLNDDLKKIERRIDVLNKELEDLNKLEPLKEEYDKKKTEEEELSNRMSEINSLIKEFRKNKKLSIGGNCPFLKEKCLNIKGQSLEDYFEEKIKELQPEQKEVEAKLSSLKKDLKKLKEEIDKLDKLKKKEGELEQARMNQNDLLRKIDVKKKEVEEKDLIKKLKADLEKYIADNKEIENKYIKLDNAKKEHDNLIKENAKYTKELNSIKENITKINAEIEPIRDIRSLIDKINKILEKNKGAYELYERNIRQAQRLDEILENIKKNEKELNSIAKMVQDLSDKLNKLRPSFNEEEYNKLEADIAELERRRSEYSGRLSEIKRTIHEKEEKVRNYEKIKVEIEEITKRIHKYKDMRGFLEIMREWYRKIGPQIVNYYLSLINQRASIYYGKIMGTVNSVLEWDQNYLLSLKIGKMTKVFNQLSGGEQMAAALSIRLAIMEALFNIGIMILDEPTTNLDIDKRRNFAELIGNLKDISQLFVISHDDTFETIPGTHHLFEKEKEETRVKSDS